MNYMSFTVFCTEKNFVVHYKNIYYKRIILNVSWKTFLASNFLSSIKYELSAFQPYLLNFNYNDANVVILKDTQERIPIIGNTILIVPPETEASAENVIAHEPSNTSCIILLCKKATFKVTCSKFGQQTSYTFLLAQDARLEFTSVFKESYDEAQLVINTYLLGNDASANIRGAYYVRDVTQFSLLTHQHHAALNTRSDLTLKGYVTDAANSVHHGAVVIEKDAQRANVSQYNKTLLGSEQAHARSTPQLEIHAHDVQCKHGTALGHIDAQQIFYLQTRGFDEKSAQKMLLEAFFAEFGASCFDFNSL